MNKLILELSEIEANSLVGVIQDAYENSQCAGDVDFILKLIFDKFPVIKEEFGEMLDES